MDGNTLASSVPDANSAAKLHALLPGVPHIESPFFASFFSADNVDEQTRRIAIELRTQGYAILDFPDPDILTMAHNIQTRLAPQYDFQTWQNAQPQQQISLRVENAWTFDEDVKRIANNEHILQLLSTLYGRPAWPFQTLNFPVGTQQHFHTDAVHFNSSPERFMCGVWVALEDIDAENGPLEYYPGSHLWPIFANEHIGRCVSEMQTEINQGLYEEMWRALVATKQLKPVPFHAKKGQALIWAANLMHGGARHLNKQRTRWSQVTHYFFDDCAYYTPMLSDTFYGKIAFRNLTNIKTGQVMPNKYAGHEIVDTAAEMETLRQVALHGFDPELYLAANPDVANAGSNPFEHFLKHGYKENRRIKPAEK